MTYYLNSYIISRYDRKSAFATSIVEPEQRRDGKMQTYHYDVWIWLILAGSLMLGRAIWGYIWNLRAKHVLRGERLLFCIAPQDDMGSPLSSGFLLSALLSRKMKQLGLDASFQRECPEKPGWYELAITIEISTDRYHENSLPNCPWTYFRTIKNTFLLKSPNGWLKIGEIPAKYRGSTFPFRRWDLDPVTETELSWAKKDARQIFMGLTKAMWRHHCMNA